MPKKPKQLTIEDILNATLQLTFNERKEVFNSLKQSVLSEAAAIKAKGEEASKFIEEFNNEAIG